MSAPAATVAIEMPQMGESVSEGTVIGWRKQVGERVEEGEPLVEISTDKVDAEVPAPASGVLVRVAVGPDETVPVGAVLGEIAVEEAAAATSPAPPAERGSEGGGSDRDRGSDRESGSDRDGGERRAEAALIDVTLPQMGESVQEGTVVEWRVAVGERVTKGQPLVEISTDKVDAEVPAPADGVVTEILVGPDDTVPVGAVLCRISAAPAGVSEAAGGDGSTAATAPARQGPAADDAAVCATPVARRAAQVHGVNLAEVVGSGPRGRITKDDVLRAAATNGGGTDRQSSRAPASQKATGAGVAAAPATTSGQVEEVPLRGPAATLARYMERSRSIPTATSFRTLEVDELDRRRRQFKAAGARLSFTHLIAWAIVQAARDWPVMAHSYAEREGKPVRLVPRTISLGIAVDVERRDGARSLLVPVIHEASELDFATFRQRYDELVAGARDGTLTPDAYQGANITLTNPGGIGTVASVPRLMEGQGTIVAAGAIGYPPGLRKIPPDRLRELGVSKVMTLTSTYDHRVIQGAESGSFLARIDELLQGKDGFYERVAADLGIELPDQATEREAAVTADEPVPAAVKPAAPEIPDEALMQAVQAATSVVKAHRMHGHLAARLDPLGSEPVGDPALDPATVNLTPELMEQIPARILRVAVPGETFAEALPHLRETYCGTIAYEIEHISDHGQRVWLRQAIESGRFRKPLPAEQKRRLLERLSQVEALEQYLRRTFLGQKQFSIEGLDMLVPMLDETIELAAQNGAREVVLGMAHRGRLNVLAHVVGRPYREIIAEFEAERTPDIDTAAPEGGTGDVKYHYGASGVRRTASGKELTVTLSPNPSHLEFVDPVVEGRARADQSDRSGPRLKRDPTAVVPVLIHGDAAFPAQGIVAETLNLSGLDGYTTGGTVHLIANNQLGFTTEPDEGRSTRYASDLAKGFDIPVIHVNADDVEACIAAVRLAFAYRARFGRDVLIDVVGYRRHGHNETDEPAYTQPTMYERIRKHPPVRKIYAERLQREGVIAQDEAESIFQQALDAIAAEHEELRRQAAVSGEQEAKCEASDELDQTMSREPRTSVDRELLQQLNDELVRVPEGFEVHRKLRPFLERRRQAFEQPDGKVDWAHAEALAFASLLALGIPVRLTGQDTVRGTFSQRHLALYDARTGERWVPIQNLSLAHAPMELHNSPLSEAACLGFEYGYSVQAQDALVLWEAQFGDFVNAAQVIVDQFIVSGLAKWGQTSRLTLLLPHGYEGAGPEHSSARPERFLQLAAEGNIRVANCTTPAQYFHLLRRQALTSVVRPLIVLTPKSLLRHPQCVSTVDELAEGSFQRVIEDPLVAPPGTQPDEQHPIARDRIRKLVLCSGKIYYEIQGHESRLACDHIAVARIELLYPFPEREIAELMASYPNLERVVWVQEEPRNMGARGYVRRRMAKILPEHLSYDYVGRQLRAAPGEGYAVAHRREQARIVRVALDLEQDTLEPDISAQRPVL
ncbi:multifunctional oxoglutarate decarboxylase/oxoglutarate dehydrogenase thiamine pyrophosphate-binding subunit/dihydrolipoyllysine-residue succinyltransferase subunit [Thermoleophilum album]|uniref:2-oxoglutarate dehydrogenase E1 component n=1 Tax=Thermoleophilum album TaxID=29539 RepID=A0A1H6FLH0_THEAL|nr:multifunctional oxoglutarate decarboxylase/oxoglutarate dehydrogenase thiamine pyrophosphate-binding subunit/dihydrolipoyllysine-residue succinyltransferase subunit [Thermoleophilum album]SEH10665.1 2-oxoglutarate dehydrogenase E1 component [Thermoleophilum album]